MDTSAPEPQTVYLEEIVIDPEMQIRGGTDRALVATYRRAMEAGEEFPPVVLARLQGVLILVDGFHRVEACIVGHVLAVIKDVRCRAEAKWLAAEGNLRHGKRLKPSKRGDVVRAYFRARRHRDTSGGRLQFKSYREMARELPGISYSFIRRLAKSEFPAIFRDLAKGPDEVRTRRGGLPPREEPGDHYAREARDALRHAKDCLAGVTDPARRRELADLARLIVEIAEPDDLDEWLSLYNQGA